MGHFKILRQTVVVKFTKFSFEFLKIILIIIILILYTMFPNTYFYLFVIIVKLYDKFSLFFNV